MNILILGSGGREHAITWKLAQSSRPLTLFVAPGNPGTAELARNLPADPLDFDAVRRAIIQYEIDMVVVGPEAPLAAGIADFIEADPLLAEVTVIGPRRAGAMLESSKDFAKGFMKRHNIPTAAYQTFTPETSGEAIDYLRAQKPPYVLKADGLAAGKGVVIISEPDEAVSRLQSMFAGEFGEAGKRVVIEEYLDGTEMSAFVITDGLSWKMLPEAKDYKRIGEGDTGSNTGGMGAVSPVPFATPEFMAKVEQEIIQPTLAGLREEGIDYRGFIFFGLMNVKGSPKVVEYNVRLGDPECEVILPRIASDLYDLLEGVARRDLGSRNITISPDAAATVILVSGGYPGAYRKGFPIHFAGRAEGSTLFHAGTGQVDGTLVTAGGRVLAVTSVADTIEGALSVSYRNAAAISFSNMSYRKDIGFDLKKRSR